MSRLEIYLAGGRTAYAPGEDLVGAVAWTGLIAPRRLELRLIWKVHSKAGDDVVTSDLSVIEDAVAEGGRPFALPLPPGPFSYHGAILRIDWLLELIDIDARVAAQVDLVIGPGREAVTLRR